MNRIENFFIQAGLTDMNEVEKSCYLAFFHLKSESIDEFTVPLICSWMKALNLAAPNVSRIAKNLNASGDIIRGSHSGAFRLHRSFITKLEAKFPNLHQKSQAVEDKGSLLPEVLYAGTFGYIQSLAKQINASFEANIFDGCAVLMRRLEEVLLILTYEKLNIASAIKDSNGNYLLLEGIVKNAASNTQLNLSRNSKRTIETIRELGNYSAHKITYTCKREYIEERTNEYRALIDELLHKSGIKT